VCKMCAHERRPLNLLLVRADVMYADTFCQSTPGVHIHSAPKVTQCQATVQKTARRLRTHSALGRSDSRQSVRNPSAKSTAHQPKKRQIAPRDKIKTSRDVARRQPKNSPAASTIDLQVPL